MQRRVSDPGAGESAVQITDKAKQAELAYQEALKQSEVILQARTLLQMQGVTAAQAESAARKAGIAVERERLKILEEQEKQFVGQSVRVAGMTEVQREMGLQAALQIKQRGLGAVTPHMLQQARQFAPQSIQKEMEKFGHTTSQYKHAVEAGIFDEGTIAAKRAETAKTDVNVRMQIALDEDKLAEKIATMMNKNLEHVIKAIEVKYEAKMAHLHEGRAPGTRPRRTG